MLFVELALIRWTGSNVLYLSYFSNFVLLGSFLGIGLGFLRAGGARDLFPWAPVALALFVVFVLLFPVEVNGSGDELIFFGTEFGRSGPPAWLMLSLVFVAVGVVMTTIAEGVARTFVRFEPLDAYRLDILGSLLGVAAFTLLAFVRAPPVAWGVVVAILFVVLLGRRLAAVGMVSVLAVVAALAQESLEPGQSWSPYYKVSTIERESRGSKEIFINVNGIPHQAIASVRQRRESQAIYFAPYERASVDLEDVLVVGAGNGTDVAIALDAGAQRVDAVEIDPRLYEIGAERHPDRPYKDPRVTVHIDDGRAFLERTERKYDLMLFALPDSLTLIAGQSSLRLESFLFTKEAIVQARDHLKPGGVLTMYNVYRQQWLIDRLAQTLKEVFARDPCVDTFGGGAGIAVLTVSEAPSAVRCSTTWTATGPVPVSVSDDDPFLYLRSRTIPGFYLLSLAIILAASALGVRLVGGRFRKMRPYVDLFFMGAAFLLLETKNVVQFALLFGTTWLVNALVFLGVLVAVLLAVEVARAARLPRPPVLYGLLFATIAVAFAVPQGALLELPYGLRFAAAAALAFAPIFVANLIFAQRFRNVSSSSVAFGANLLGAMVGGTLEYVSLVVGYRLLLLIVAGLYAAALLSAKRSPPVGV
jgi:hypothetical protein